MKSEEEKILSMVEEGAISADEAQELLNAIEEQQYAAWQPGEADAPPDMNYYRAHWQRPFGAALVTTGISASLLLRTRKAGLFGRLFRLLVLWPVTIIGGLVTIITYLSKDAPWLHVRVRPEDGPKINISLPLPLQVARMGIEIARSNAPTPEVNEQLEAVSEFLSTIEDEGISDPLTIDVADDGTQVQVFIG